ncbi:hypothetical protein [Cytobacillus purgationiresistens]|nr:hypothetical protein [Cytobacillus purgationiresistens]
MGPRRSEADEDVQRPPRRKRALWSGNQSTAIVKATKYTKTDLKKEGKRCNRQILFIILQNV